MLWLCLDSPCQEEEEKDLGSLANDKVVMSHWRNMAMKKVNTAFAVQSEGFWQKGKCWRHSPRSCDNSPVQLCTITWVLVTPEDEIIWRKGQGKVIKKGRVQSWACFVCPGKARAGKERVYIDLRENPMEIEIFHGNQHSHWNRWAWNREEEFKERGYKINGVFNQQKGSMTGKLSF